MSSQLVDQLAGSQAELVAEQEADSSLIELFDRVVPVSEVRNTAHLGALRHFHQTPKSLLSAYCIELLGDWEDRLSWLVLAVCEV